MARVESVNVGVPRTVLRNASLTGIDKVPTAGPVTVSPPGPKGSGGSGFAGDVIGDWKHHGGDDQAVYAYAREDLDWWQTKVGSPLRSGMFGENLTTLDLDLDLDVTGARIGERWRIGAQLLLQVTSPRIPCATFAVWMGERGWLQSFTERAHPGAYLRVLEAGTVEAGDAVSIEERPAHEVTIGTMFRALTREPELLPSLLDAARFLNEETLARVHERRPVSLAEDPFPL